MPDSASPRPDHVVFDIKTRSMACRHCGHSQPLKLPISVTVLNELTTAYLKLHGACLAQAEDETPADDLMNEAELAGGAA